MPQRRLPQAQVMPSGRAAMSRSSERNSYMMTLSVKASASPLFSCAFSLEMAMPASRR